MKYLPIFVIALIFLFSPVDVALAQGPLVTCTNGAECGSCELISMINRIIVWLIGILFMVFAVIMVIAGFGLVTSAGNQSALDAAKSKFTNAIVGLIIVLAAWLIVDTVMRGLVGGFTRDGQTVAEGELGGRTATYEGWGPWSRVECTTQTQAQAAPTPPPGGGVVVTPTPPGPGTGNLVTYSGYQFDSAIIDRVTYIDQNFDLRVSGGHRTPERNAQVNGSPTSHHLTGRAADFVGTPAAMEAGAQWARANGAREAFVHNAGSGTHLHVAW